MLKNKKYKRGIAFGVFDIFHIGHLNYLELSSKECEVLYVGVRGDRLKTPGKDKKTLFTENIRCKLINSLQCVAEAFVFNVSLDNSSYWNHWIQDKQVEIVFVGIDWKNSNRWLKLEPILKKQKVIVKYLPRTKKISSSTIFSSITEKTIKK